MKIKLLPAIMTVLSALYFFYVLTSKDTTLVADAVGGDPGGKMLPMIMAVFMFVGFLYITIKERPDGNRMNEETKRLFCITLVLTILYVLLIKPVGFIISSVVLVYTLEYLFVTIDENRCIKEAVAGGTATVIISSAVFVVMRMITKTLMNMGRNAVLPAIFAVSTFEAGISMVFVALMTLVFVLTIGKVLKQKGQQRIANASIIAFATVLLLYVIFRQFFNVNLAAGLLNY